jgi:hypothetical protein
VLQVAHWFNPLVWVAFHTLRIDQEAACDAYILSRIKKVTPADYAHTIISLLESFCQNRGLPALAGIVENKSQMSLFTSFSFVIRFLNNIKDRIQVFGFHNSHRVSTGLVFQLLI